MDLADSEAQAQHIQPRRCRRYVVPKDLARTNSLKSTDRKRRERPLSRQRSIGESPVTFDARSLYSDLAASDPPLFFPDPPAPVTFNFDQGIASEETFPIAQIRRLLNEVLDRDEGRALEYISFGYDRDTDSIEYLPTYIELVLGHIGLRSQVATWLSRRQGLSGLGPDNLILTSGSVQAIALAAAGFVNPGEGVLVESA